jgi:RNA polymerase sigma factor (sigma-70 family)
MNKILIVDDEPGVVVAIQALLESYDIESETAWDCDSAVSLLESEYFPVVLADLRLRTEDEGFRLLEAVRRLSPRSHVASMTGYATPQTEAQLRERGAQLVLHKPIAGDVMITALREMLAAVEEAEAAHGTDPDELYAATLDTLQAISRGRYRFSTEDTEELIQEAWVLYLEKARSIHSPKAWLTGTVANLCKQEIARRQRERLRDGESLEPSVTPADDAVLSIRQGLEKIDERSRTLCTLLGIEEWSYEEVAASMDIPVGSVGPFYQRARQRLQRAMSN